MHHFSRAIISGLLIKKKLYIKILYIFNNNLFLEWKSTSRNPKGSCIVTV